MKTKMKNALLVFALICFAVLGSSTTAFADSTEYLHGKLFPDGTVNSKMSKVSGKEDYGSIDFRISNYSAYVIYTKLGTTKISNYTATGTIPFYPFNYSDYKSKKASADYTSRYNCITDGLASRTKNFAGTWWVAVINEDNFSVTILVNGGTKKTVDGVEILPFADFASMDKGLGTLSKAYAYNDVSATDLAACQKLGTYLTPVSNTITTNKGQYFYYPASYSKERDKTEDVTDTKYTVLAKNSSYSVAYEKNNVYWNEDNMATACMARSFARFKFVIKTDGTHTVTLPISFHTGLVRNSITTAPQCDSQGLAVCTKNYILKDAESGLAVTMVKNPNNHNTDKGMTYVKDTNNGTADEPWHIKKRLCCGDIIKHERCELKETKAATCTTTGTLECSLCHQTKTIPAIGHNMIHHEAIEATCTEAGQKEYWECSNCNKKFADANGTQVLTSVTVNKLGHDFTAEVEDEQYIKTAGNCTKPNTYYRCCSRCGEKGTTSFTGSQAAGHNLEFHEGTPATCTESGTIDYYECSECGKKMTEDNPQCTTYITNIVAPKISHDYSGSEVSDEYLKSEATCTKPAVYYHCCTMCGAKGTSTFEDGEALGHTYEENESDWVVRKEPTCTSTGTRVGTCTRCSSSTVGHTKTEIIDTIDHEDDCNYVVSLRPTCTEPGREESHCTMCHKVMDTREIPATGHDVDESQLLIVPTCTTDGLAQGQCKICGKVLDNEVIPAKGHSFDRNPSEWTVIKEPTCTEDGVMKAVCTDCQEEKTKSIDKLGHVDDGIFTVETPATCASTGREATHCKYCGQEIAGITQSRVIPLDDSQHEYGDWIVTKNATCAEEGTKERFCTHCNHKDTGVVEKTNDHVYDGGITYVAPTTSLEGSRRFTCTLCEHVKYEPIPKLTQNDYVVSLDTLIEAMKNNEDLDAAQAQVLIGILEEYKKAGIESVSSGMVSDDVEGAGTLTDTEMTGLANVLTGYIESVGMPAPKPNETVDVVVDDNPSGNNNTDSGNQNQNTNQDQNQNQNPGQNQTTVPSSGNDVAVTPVTKNPTDTPAPTTTTTDKTTTDTTTTTQTLDTKTYQTLETVSFGKTGFLDGQNTYTFKSDGETFRIVYEEKNGTGSYQVEKLEDTGWVKVPSIESTTSNTSVYTYRLIENADGTKSISVVKNKKLVLKKTAIKTAKSLAKKKMTVKIKKVSGITGYEVKISTSKSFAKKQTKSKTLSAKKTTWTFTKLKSKKTYYVKARTYKKVNGKKVYSKWSKVKKVKTK